VAETEARAEFPAENLMSAGQRAAARPGTALFQPAGVANGLALAALSG
jgi:hypothetical protein